MEPVPDQISNYDNFSENLSLLVALAAILVSPIVTFIVAKIRENAIEKRFKIEETRRQASNLMESLSELLAESQQLATYTKIFYTTKESGAKVSQKVLVQMRKERDEAINNIVKRSTKIILLLNEKKEAELVLLKSIQTMRAKTLDLEGDINLEELAINMSKVAESAHAVLDEWRNHPH